MLLFGFVEDVFFVGGASEFIFYHGFIKGLLFCGEGLFGSGLPVVLDRGGEVCRVFFRFKIFQCLGRLCAEHVLHVFQTRKALGNLLLSRFLLFGVKDAFSQLFPVGDVLFVCLSACGGELLVPVLPGLINAG